MPLEKLIKRDVQTLSPDATCSEAARLMRDSGVGSVVVVEDGRPIGIVTDRDLVLRVIARGEDPAKLPVRRAMSEKPIFLSKERGLDQLIEAMGDLAVRRVPIVDERQKLVGILALDDVIVLLAGQLARIADAVKKEM
jgi:CBS domain-containing protein